MRHSSASPARPGSTRQYFAPDRLARLDRLVQQHIDAGRIPGAAYLVCHRDQVVHQAVAGVQDPADGRPLQADSIFRIYSMTKPVVSVAIMMLVEQGLLAISDPVSRYLPALARLSVGVEQVAGTGEKTLVLEPARREITVQDLLRHTSGLTYGAFGDSLVHRAYRNSPVESGRRLDNQQMVEALGQLPLVGHPGEVWEYGRSTDVLGALVERIGGLPLDEFLERHILQPLGMPDTGFWVPQSQQYRMAEPFATDPGSGRANNLFNMTRKPAFLSAGGGMVSTLADYLRFCRMLAGGGTLDGLRIVAPQTLALMTTDHLEGLPIARTGPAYLPGQGYGFGLGFAVRTHAAAPAPGSVGDYQWSGMGGTYFWIDPQEDLLAIWMTQAPVSSGWYREFFRNIVYAAL
ncbi:MAG: beta-lactamase family protein [Paucimonas sp.]|nr:beta-lactamase family protein [Paucimonas sp.]